MHLPARTEHIVLGAGVTVETTDGREAYAGQTRPGLGPYEDGWLPDR